MVCPISITKFVGTISLGILTGVSYTLSAIALPSLAHLPTATLASSALTSIQTHSTRHILTLASLSSLSLLTVYSLAAPRGKHPYLLWTALTGFAAGQGVEWWYNGFERFSLVDPGKRGMMGESGYVEVEENRSERVVNGEKVEMEMVRERKVQRVRGLVAGVGFAMGVVGIWGDGA